MEKIELAVALDLAAAEGWNPGLSDADAFHACDPNGFFLAESKEQILGCISAVAYGEDYGFIGLFLVKPELRGGVIGLRLRDAALEYLGDRNIGLDGVLAKQKNYQNAGYKIATRNIRYEGVGKVFSTSREVFPLNEVPFEEIVAFDASFFFAPRPAFLQFWLDQEEGLAVGRRRNGQLTGMGVLRACRSGYKIGPLCADSPEIAAEIFEALSNHAKDAPLFLDVPENNPAAVALTEKYGMKRVFETARMYSKEAPDLPIGKIFGITTFELG